MLKPGDVIAVDFVGHALHGNLVEVVELVEDFNLAPPGMPPYRRQVIFVRQAAQTEPIGIDLAHVAGTRECIARRADDRVEAARDRRRYRRKLLTRTRAKRKDSASGAVRSNQMAQGQRKTTTSRKNTGNASVARQTSQANITTVLTQFKNYTEQSEQFFLQCQQIPQLQGLDLQAGLSAYGIIWKSYAQMLEYVVMARGGRPSNSTLNQDAASAAAGATPMPAGGRGRRNNTQTGVGTQQQVATG